jgi:hypothetical protein
MGVIDEDRVDMLSELIADMVATDQENGIYNPEKYCRQAIELGYRYSEVEYAATRVFIRRYDDPVDVTAPPFSTRNCL